MQIDTKLIAEGNLNGQIVWICDYRRPDKTKKAIRNVPPTQVVVRNKEEAKKKIYYSESFFSPLKSNGEPSSKEISLFDNTGFRSFTGVALNVFDNEEECIEKWNSSIQEEIEHYQKKKQTVLNEIDSHIETLNNSIK